MFYMERKEETDQSCEIEAFAQIRMTQFLVQTTTDDLKNWPNVIHRLAFQKRVFSHHSFENRKHSGAPRGCLVDAAWHADRNASISSKSRPDSMWVCPCVCSIHGPNDRNRSKRHNACMMGFTSDSSIFARSNGFNPANKSKS